MSLGMTPFRPTVAPSLQSTPKGSARPTPPTLSKVRQVLRVMQPRQALAVEALRQSHPLSEGGRDLAASRYAPLDHTSTSVAEALGTMSLSTLGRTRGGNATNTSRRGAQDENTNPRHANLTSNSTERPMARGSSRVPAAPYKPISSTRRPAGLGFDVLQAEIAAANAHRNLFSHPRF